MIPKQLRRKKNNRILGGVASGLAEYFKTDVVLVRILFAIACIGAFSGVPVYIICWILIPEENGDETVQYTDYEEVKQEDNPKQDNCSKQQTNKENTIHNSNYWRFFLAILFIFIGVYFLLQTHNIIGFSFRRLIKVWPIIFVLIGIGFLNFNRWIKYTLNMIILILVLFFVSKSPSNINHENAINENITTISNSGSEEKTKLNYFATSKNLDFSNHKLSSLDLEIAAADISLKLGYPEQITPIKIDVSTSNLIIRVPCNANCKFIDESTLSSFEFYNFKCTNNEYFSENFDDTKPYFHFTIEAVFSKVKVETY